MVTNKKVYGKAMSIPAGVGIGAVTSLLIMISGCALLAVLIDREMINMETLGYGAMAVLLLSTFFGAGIAASLVRHRKLMICLIQAVCYFAMLLLINGLTFGGAVSGVWVTALLLVGGAVCAALLQVPKERKRKSVNRKWRTG